MTAPKRVESIPAVTAPVQIPKAEETPMGRRQYLAGLIAGGVAGSLALALLVVGLVVL